MQLNSVLSNIAKSRGYNAVPVSWEDLCRSQSSDGTLSNYGPAICDVSICDKQKRPIWTVRSENYNEKLVFESADNIYLVVGNEEPSPHKKFRSVTLQEYLQNFGQYTKYANVPADTNLFVPELDNVVSIRFQTVFVPQDTELSLLTYSYGTESLLLFSTAQGTSVDEGKYHKNLFHHMVDGSRVEASWLKAVASDVRVGASQAETKESQQASLAAGHAVAMRMGPKHLADTFNTVMLVQVPLKQPPRPYRILELGYESCVVQKQLGSSDGFVTRGGSRTTEARMSKGSVQCQNWPGISSEKRTRHESQHVTVTMTAYRAIHGEVPTEEDVHSAINELDARFGRFTHLKDAPTTQKSAFTYSV